MYNTETKKEYDWIGYKKEKSFYSWYLHPTRQSNAIQEKKQTHLPA